MSMLIKSLENILIFGVDICDNSQMKNAIELQRAGHSSYLGLAET